MTPSASWSEVKTRPLLQRLRLPLPPRLPVRGRAGQREDARVEGRLVAHLPRQRFAQPGAAGVLVELGLDLGVAQPRPLHRHSYAAVAGGLAHHRQPPGLGSPEHQVEGRQVLHPGVAVHPADQLGVGQVLVKEGAAGQHLQVLAAAHAGGGDVEPPAHLQDARAVPGGERGLLIAGEAAVDDHEPQRLCITECAERLRQLLDQGEVAGVPARDDDAFGHGCGLGAGVRAVNATLRTAA